MPDLIVTPYTPTLRSGRALRTYAVARALDGAEILFTRFGASAPAPQYEGIPMRGIEGSRGASRLALYAAARARGVPDAFARMWTPELRAAALASLPTTRLVADGPGVASMLLGRRPVVYLAHNIESQLDRPGARSMRRFERRLLLGAEESWMVSERDIDIARELAPTARMRLVPNVIDVAAIEPQAAAGETALLIGDYAYEPNEQALRFMLEQVMPRLWQANPQAKLRVVGRSMPSLEDCDPRVEALGEVDDLRAAYTGAACAVVPLFSGSGSPLKFVEALAYGLPVIATGLAAAGLEVVAGEHYLRADDAASFSATLATVLTGDATAVARSGQDLARTHYSIQSLRKALAQ